MIQQSNENVKTQSELNSKFITTIKELKISNLLHESNIRKDARTQQSEISCEKRTAFEIFQFLLLMVFQGCNLFHFLGSKKQDIACSKSTYHRFLSDPHNNWKRFITQLAAKVIDLTDKLTNQNRFKAFVLDDSFIGRKRSKKVELMAFIFDHVSGKKQKGFNLLTLGWTDGFSFLPVAFNMLSSSNESARLNGINEKIDKRTVGYRNRQEAIQHKPDAAIAMIKEAIKQESTQVMYSWIHGSPMNLLSNGLQILALMLSVC